MTCASEKNLGSQTCERKQCPSNKPLNGGVCLNHKNGNAVPRFVNRCAGRENGAGWRIAQEREK